MNFSRVKALLDHYVDSDKLPGSALLVSKDHQEVVYLQNGYMDVERQRPMSRDTIFRIYSMSKPVTSVALMQLWEKSLIQLDDPVSKFIPALQDLQVFTGGNVDDYTSRKVDREMTVIDLLRHTSGLTYGFDPQHPVDQMYHRQGLFFPRRDSTLAEGVEKLAKLPLCFSPGESWNYSIATDVVGYLVELVSGQPLDIYFRQHIFEPLEMNDTAFHVDKNNQPRFAACYEVGEDNEEIRLQDDPMTSPYLQVPQLFSGGAGLVSSIDDYHQFAQMTLAGGEWRDRRILKSATMEMMRQNHLPNGQDLAALGQSEFCETRFDGVGFGLGYSVILYPQQAGVSTSVGEYAWGGMASTYHWVDPEENIAAVFMTQLIPSDTYTIRNELKDAVYKVLVTENQ